MGPGSVATEEEGSAERLAVARELAHEAGSLLASFFRTSPTVHKKGAVDLVTEADRQSEALILEGIRSRFPGDGILAEESGGDLDTGAPWTWVVDPLDGTTNFVHGLDHFAVSIGVLRQGTPALGVVGVPARGEVYWASRGNGAWGPDGRLQVTAERDLGSALVATGFPYERREQADALARGVKEALLRTRGVRRMGAAALDLLGVARGFFGGYWEAGISPWDVAGGLVLVEEAGGRVTDLDGRPVTDLRCRRFLATNGHLHQAMLTMLEPTLQV